MLSDSAGFGDVPRQVGGYRVVRTLASTQQGIRLLVHADGHARVAHVFDRACPDEVIDHQIAVCDALRSAREALGQHVSAVLDLCSTDDGRFVVIEEHLAGPRLDLLVRDRHPPIALGEVVTILAPLASAIEEAHRIGLTGLLVDAAAVRFRATGAPVLTRCSTVRIGPPLPERFRDRESRYAADRGALERVGAAIATTLTSDDEQALLGALHRSGAALEHALFDLAPPLPVRFGSGRRPSSDAPAAVTRSTQLGAQVTTDAGVAAGVVEAERMPLQNARAALAASLDSSGLPPAVVAAVLDAADGTARALRRVTSVARTGAGAGGRLMRPRFALAGLAGAAALIVAIVVASQPSGPEAGAAEAPERATDGGPGASAGEQTTGSRASTSSPGLAESELHPDPEMWPSLVGQLIDRWVDCAPGRDEVDETAQGADGPSGDAVSSRGCAAAVVHEGSAAARLITTDDRRHGLLRAWKSAGGDVVVVERMGAAVLVDLVTDATTTASLLVVRSEAGWRIREVIGETT